MEVDGASGSTLPQGYKNLVRSIFNEVAATMALTVKSMPYSPVAIASAKFHVLRPDVGMEDDYPVRLRNFAGWCCTRTLDTADSPKELERILANQKFYKFCGKTLETMVRSYCGVEERFDGGTRFYAFPWVLRMVESLDEMAKPYFEEVQYKK